MYLNSHYKCPSTQQHHFVLSGGFCVYLLMLIVVHVHFVIALWSRVLLVYTKLLQMQLWLVIKPSPLPLLLHLSTFSCFYNYSSTFSCLYIFDGSHGQLATGTSAHHVILDKIAKSAIISQKLSRLPTTIAAYY